MKFSLIPYYQTQFGAAYDGDSCTLLQNLEDNSVDLIITSPPYALLRKKSYGNEDQDKYIAWFLQFAKEAKRVLKDSGSFVIEIGGSWNEGAPTRSIYHYELLISLVKELGFFLPQEFFWYNPAKMPGPAQWVNIKRIRATDAVNSIWWLSKSDNPKANNKRVLNPYSESMKKLLKCGYNSGPRPSGHVVSKQWQKDHGGAIPKNILVVSNTSSSDPYQKSCRKLSIPLHPARFPREIPEFFIKFLTDPGDLVVDIFAGSNVTGAVCEDLKRKWLAFEINSEYLEASKFRFGLTVDPQKAGAKVKRQEDA